MWGSLYLYLGLSYRLCLNFGLAGNFSLSDLLVYIGSREACRKYDMYPQVIRKVDGIFPMSSGSIYACLLKLSMWAYSVFRVVILEHSLTLFLLKIFSNSELGMTGATFDRITLWAGVNIGL